MAKKIFILRTNSLVSSEDSTLRFDSDNEIVIPFPEGIDELRKLSVQYTEKGKTAKKVLDYFDSLNFRKLTSKYGVRQKNGSILRFEQGKDFDDSAISNLGELSKFDKKCLKIAKGLSAANNENIPVIIVSRNPAFRMKAKSLGIMAQNFRDEMFPNPDEQYTGRVDCSTSQAKISEFYSSEMMNPKDIFEYSKIEWHVNMFLNIKAYDNPNSTVIARFDGKNIVPLKFAKTRPFNIKPLKAGQYMALEALMQPPEVAPLVLIKGAAGTGKTFLSLAVALQQTIESNPIYNQILITTPAETLREENLGFLPGDFEQKFDPYLGGLMDNLRLLLSSHEPLDKNENEIKTISKSKKSSKRSNDADAESLDSDGEKTKNYANSFRNGKANTQFLLNQGIVQMQLIGHLRGRSIMNTFFIIDETQNIEPSIIKSIMTRAAKGAKFVFLGDITQIDNPDLNENFNGLTFSFEKFKDSPLCWQLTLENEESVRSNLAREAAKIL